MIAGKNRLIKSRLRLRGHVLRRCLWARFLIFIDVAGNAEQEAWIYHRNLFPPRRGWTMCKKVLWLSQAHRDAFSLVIRRINRARNNLRPKNSILVSLPNSNLKKLKNELQERFSNFTFDLFSKKMIIYFDRSITLITRNSRGKNLKSLYKKSKSKIIFLKFVLFK